MFFGIAVAHYDDHVARAAQEGFRPLTFSQFLIIQYTIQGPMKQRLTSPG
jgi:hypothetical protein